MRSGSCCITSSSCDPGRSASSRWNTIWSQMLKTTSSSPFTSSHSFQSWRVQPNGTPFRKPRKSGGSPSGVSSPPQFETTKMKKTMMWVLRSRGAFARSSGRINSTEAPVVPIAFASTAPRPSSAVLSSGVPESAPRTRIPPVTTKRAPSSRMNEAYSLPFSSSSCTPAAPCAATRYAATGSANSAVTIPRLRLLSQKCGVRSGRIAIESSSPANGSTVQSGRSRAWVIASPRTGRRAG